MQKHHSNIAQYPLQEQYARLSPSRVQNGVFSACVKVFIYLFIYTVSGNLQAKRVSSVLGQVLEHFCTISIAEDINFMQLCCYIF